jgi:hypothetical protein
MEQTRNLFRDFNGWFSCYVPNYGLSFEINGKLFKDSRIIYDTSFNLEWHPWSLSVYFSWFLSLWHYLLALNDSSNYLIVIRRKTWICDIIFGIIHVRCLVCVLRSYVDILEKNICLTILFLRTSYILSLKGMIWANYLSSSAQLFKWCIIDLSRLIKFVLQIKFWL